MQPTTLKGDEAFARELRERLALTAACRALKPAPESDKPAKRSWFAQLIWWMKGCGQ
jgi:hypothetical protein